MNQISFWGDLVARDINGLCLCPEIKQILCESTFNIVNFEAPIENTNRPILKNGPNNTQSKQAPMWAMKNGFNLFSFANNHSFDYGEDGLNETISCFPKEMVIGAGDFKEAYKCKVLQLENGIKVGIIAGTHKEFGTLDDEFTQKEEKGTAWLFHRKIVQEILKVRQFVDYLYIYAHAGVEFIEQPLPELRSAFRYFIDLGCDGVICSHPHIPMGWEYYKEKPIMYSLGNFCFQKPGLLEEQLRPYWNHSLAYIISFENNEPKMEIVPLKYELSSNMIVVKKDDEYMTHLQLMCNTLLNTDSYMKYIEKAVLDLFATYKVMLNLNTPKNFWGVIREIKRSIYFKNEKIELVNTLNAVQCESHRWAIVRAIKLLTK